MSNAGRAVTINNPDARGPIVLVCEHASNLVPMKLHGLGLDADALASHIAWDPGALGVACALSDRLHAPLVFPQVSRLIVDVNRALDSPTLIVEKSDGVVIPGNRSLSARHRRCRVEHHYHPFHSAVAEVLDRAIAGGERPVVVSIHSFNRVVLGRRRPWNLGVIFDSSQALAAKFLASPALSALTPLAPNQPYSPADGVFFTLGTHAGARGLEALMLEICNDQLTCERSQIKWADAVAEALSAIVPGAERRADQDSNATR